jgi:formylglycine-generating enzyme required for sulfatase activity
LIPIRRDQHSGLWEFFVYGTGDPPAYTGDAPYQLSEQTGIVLVLLPGGEFWMGATADSLGIDGVDDRNPYARPDEGPPHRVRLDPFFLSKYEMTQGQWLGITDSNPSTFRAGRIFHGIRQTLLFPVENVAWYDVNRALKHVGLRLPTEAQWEYGARAGTSTPWPCGDDPDCLEAYANICDLSARESGASRTWEFTSWNDGFPRTAPVGLFLPNAWGLHDAIGNASEFVSDWMIDYSNPTRPGTGERVGTGAQKIARGSIMNASRYQARPTLRMPYGIDTVGIAGVRPARLLEAVNRTMGAQR